MPYQLLRVTLGVPPGKLVFRWRIGSRGRSSLKDKVVNEALPAKEVDGPPPWAKLPNLTLFGA